MDWKRLFDDTRLGRGYEYFIDDCVDNLERKKDALTADVYGTRDYEVEIRFEKGQIKRMTCSCPYASDETPCKHMAAVLYAWEDMGEDDIEDGNGGEFDSTEEGTGEGDEIASLIAKADEKTVRSFLTETLKANEKLLLKFKMRIEPAVSAEDMKKYKKNIDSIVRRHMGRGHFIDYYEASSFAREIENVLGEDVGRMLEDGCYQAAFELTCYVFVTVANVDMDDSDGGTGEIAEQCFEIWSGLLEDSDAGLEKTMYTWFVDHVNGSLVDYMEEYIEDILTEGFHSAEYLKLNLELTEKKALEAQKGGDSWSCQYQTEKWALKHIRLLEESRASWEMIADYCETKWNCSGVRQYYINKCLEQGYTDRAVDVLKESIAADKDKPGLIKKYRVQLKDLYKEYGKQEDYCQELWKLVTEDAVGELELFRELKSQYTEQEWEKAREKVFASPACRRCLDQFYQEEKLYDRLLDIVMGDNGIWTVRKYTDTLKGQYPEQLLDKYEEELENMACHTANRKRYQEWVGILQSMKRIDGGTERVSKIVERWRTVYRNRPAMIEELRRL